MSATMSADGGWPRPTGPIATARSSARPADTWTGFRPEAPISIGSHTKTLRAGSTEQTAGGQHGAGMFFARQAIRQIADTQCRSTRRPPPFIATTGSIFASTTRCSI